MELLSPFLQGSFIPYNMLVYPGALRFAGHPAGIRVLNGRRAKLYQPGPYLTGGGAASVMP